MAAQFVHLSPHIHCPDVDACLQFRGRSFVWNADKAASNLQKHKLSFERACEVSLDPLMKLWDASVLHGRRLAAVGTTLDRDVLFVVHIEMEEGGLVRVISARYATRSERETYEVDG